MFNLDFISKMYNNKNSYAEIFTTEQLENINVSTELEGSIKDFIKKKKIVFLTGNPGDGKTHLIRILKNYLEQHETFLELDINEVRDLDGFLNDLRNNILSGKPALIAVNEYPFYDLLKLMPEDFPYKESIIEAKSHILLYGDQTYDIYKNKVIVIDLNYRNLLNKIDLESIFEQIINNTQECNICDVNLQCMHTKSLNSLKNEVIQSRIIKLITMISNRGNHVVMRDIIGFISYILTAGKSCKEVGDLYFDRIFEGESQIFQMLKDLDPAKLTNPVIDELLWNGNIVDGWLVTPPNKIPNNIEDADEATKIFISLKRKYFFEHTDGMKLISLYPTELKTFMSLISESYDNEIETIKSIIYSINKFYYPSDSDDNKLNIWSSHYFEAKKHPETIISNRNVPYQSMEVLIPKTPSGLQSLGYSPDHFIMRVKPSSNNLKFVDLKIDYNLYRMLHLVSEGFPPEILNKSHKFIIERFMFNLSSLTNELQTNEFMVKTSAQKDAKKIIIKDGKYFVKTR